MSKPTNPYSLTPEQIAAYSTQIAKEKRERAARAKGEDIRELREWLKQDVIDADQIKFGGCPASQRYSNDQNANECQ